MTKVRRIVAAGTLVAAITSGAMVMMIAAAPPAAAESTERLIGVGCIGSDCYLVYERANGSLVWIPIA